jgi:septum formation protein
METKIILASSSVYRRELLKRIVSDFEFISPEIEESQRDNESPIKMALRLSEEKAKKNCSVIGY